jgi:hypothetical protein
MNSIKVCFQIPSALLECCELAAHLRIPASKTEEMKNKAREMAAQFGDVNRYNYEKKCKKIARILFMCWSSSFPHNKAHCYLYFV